MCTRIKNEEARKNATSLNCFSSVLCNASRSCEGACLNVMSVSLSNKGKPLKLRHYDISRAHFQGTAQRLIYIKLPADVQRGAVHRTATGVRRWSGSLVKAQASARLDVPTAPHHFSTVRTKKSNACVHFSREGLDVYSTDNRRWS